MGQRILAQEKSIVNIWTSMLERKGKKYDTHMLKALILWCKKQGLYIDLENMFYAAYWEKTRKLIIESASQGDQSAKYILTTWRTPLDTLKLLKAEKDAEMAAPLEAKAIGETGGSGRGGGVASG